MFGAADATLFCLGTPSVGLSEPQYTRITRDFERALRRLCDDRDQLTV
ncbi:hypothetical protein ACIA5D_25545 [Actinoplanes sp. NPDC051513]